MLFLREPNELRKQAISNHFTSDRRNEKTLPLTSVQTTHFVQPRKVHSRLKLTNDILTTGENWSVSKILSFICRLPGHGHVPCAACEHRKHLCLSERVWVQLQQSASQSSAQKW